MTIEVVGINLSTSEATAVASSTSANTKGDWVEIDASTSLASDGFWVYIGVNSGANFDCLVDIGIGAEGSEVVLIPNILYSTGDVAGESILIPFPISIASGVRLSARVQDREASATTIDVAIIITDDSGLDITAYTACDVMGAVTGDSGGTQIDPGGSANTKNGYVEVVASTSNTYKALLIIVGQIQNAGMSNGHFLFDVAIGAESSEVNFLSDISLISGSTSDTLQNKVIGPMASDIPSGSRLSVQAQSSITNPTDRLFDVVLYGIH